MAESIDDTDNEIAKLLQAQAKKTAEIKSLVERGTSPSTSDRIAAAIAGIGASMAGQNGIATTSGLIDKSVKSNESDIQNRIKALDDDGLPEGVKALQKLRLDRETLARQSEKDAYDRSMKEREMTFRESGRERAMNPLQEELLRAKIKSLETSSGSGDFNTKSPKTSSGGGGGKRLPPDKVLSVNEGNSIPTLLDDVENTIKSNADEFGPIMGLMSGNNPYNTKGQATQSQISAISQAFGRYMEGGVLRKEDEIKYAKMFPSLRDTPDAGAAKLENVRRLLSQRQRSNLDALRASGYNTDGVDKGISVSAPPSILSGPQTKVIRGVTYQKVSGGWAPVK